MRSIQGEVWNGAWDRIETRAGAWTWDWVARQVWEPVRDRVEEQVFDHVWDEVKINA